MSKKTLQRISHSKLADDNTSDLHLSPRVRSTHGCDPNRRSIACQQVWVRDLGARQVVSIGRPAFCLKVSAGGGLTHSARARGHTTLPARLRRRPRRARRVRPARCCRLERPLAAGAARNESKHRHWMVQVGLGSVRGVRLGVSPGGILQTAVGR